MKHDIRDRALTKGLAVLLFIALGVASAFGVIYCGLHWDTLFNIGDFTYSSAWNRARNDALDQLNQRLEYEWIKRCRGELSYLEQKNYQALLSELDPAMTNFRYTVRDNATGQLLFSSTGEDSLTDAIDLFTTLRWYDARDGIEVDYDSDRELYVWTDRFGGEVALTQDPDTEPPAVTALPSAQWAVEYGVARTLPVHDAFYEARASFRSGDVTYFYLTVALLAALVLLGVFLLCCAGRRRSAETFVLNWQDKIPYDLYLCAAGAGVCLTFGWAVSSVLAAYRYYEGQSYAQVLDLTAGALFALSFGLLSAALMSTAARVKTGTLLKNTLLWRLLGLVGRGYRALGHWWRETFGSWDVTAQVILLYLLYLLAAHLVPFTVVLWPVFHGAVIFLLCRWLKSWKAIRAGTAVIVGGHPETAIDTSAMDCLLCRDLKAHAEQLNDLGGAIDSAVKEQLKSERMKAELITNVSHDLKTPLTSIINYVDLLKKEDIENETAKGYIEVLDRKSQRLKKLTEDLVEASKASTGALTVNAERIGVTQLATQALGEYAEKFAAAQLTAVPALTEEEVYVTADGRHLWRILDNLLGNCVKYALPGTRVYLDVAAWDGWVSISVKNISAQQLNIPPERLMERFVRGDESRTSEGSGLGLSIARSLTELNGGSFALSIDGDLFKATAWFPETSPAGGRG